MKGIVHDQQESRPPRRSRRGEVGGGDVVAFAARSDVRRRRPSGRNDLAIDFANDNGRDAAARLRIVPDAGDRT
jgi:hypothetical protein